MNSGLRHNKRMNDALFYTHYTQLKKRLIAMYNKILLELEKDKAANSIAYCDVFEDFADSIEYLIEFFKVRL